MADDWTCGTCDHAFLARHLETDRRLPLLDEILRRRCNDCVDCNPPEDAPLRERRRELEGAGRG